jgi:drug/metabolite transporter (DMT)-like permease
VNPLVGGIIAALCWGLSTVVASRSTKILGAQEVLSWVLIISMFAVGAIAIGSGEPANPHPSAWVWAMVAGLGSGLGLLFMYEALRIGKVGVVSPIASTEGAIAALLSVLVLGETLTVAVAASLAVIVAGVVVVTLQGGRSDVHLRSSILAIGAATFFGIGLVASARGGADLGPYWTIFVARIVSVILIAGPLVVRGRLPWPRATLWMVAFSAVAETVGFVTYVLAAQQSVAIAAVLGSQFAAVAAYGSYLAFGERLGRRQLAGAAVIIAGVTMLAVARG